MTSELHEYVRYKDKIGIFWLSVNKVNQTCLFDLLTSCMSPASPNVSYPYCKYLPWPLAALLDGYTFYSVSQERIMDEIDEEAKRARMQGPKTGANWDAGVALPLPGLWRHLCGHGCAGFEGWLSCCWLKPDLSWFLLKFDRQWKGLIHWPLHDLTCYPEGLSCREITTRFSVWGQCPKS